MPRKEYFVDYSTFDAGVESKTTHICFSQVNHIPDKFIYRARIKDDLKDDAVLHYAAFLKLWLEDRFTVEIVDLKDTKVEPHRAVWALDCKGMKLQELRLYLTAFRYVDEFYLLINKWIEFKDNIEPDDSFRLFQILHYAIESQLNNVGGHGLMCSYCKSGGQSISIERFKANVKEGKPNVGSHFS